MRLTPCRTIVSVLMPILLLALHMASNPQSLFAYTHESPEVKEMVKKAMAFLEDAKHEQPGGMALVGTAFLKSGAGDRNHPKVREAISRARELAQKVSREGVGENCYNEAIACIFLCEAGPEEFQAEIRALLGALLNRQQQSGCWGYKPHTYDDTSQTQYGMLALWTAHSAGVAAQTPRVERAMQWLFGIQAKDGGYPYNPSSPVSLSMSAAGLGSVYVGAHLLGFGVQREGAKEKEKSTLPPALQLVGAKKKKSTEFQTLRPQTINASMVRRATSAGNAWFDKNFGAENEDQRFTYYYLYGLERYKSFKEIVEGENVAEPAWYNAGVDYLKAEQEKNGSWNKGMIGASADTAFAVLFLVRSSKKSIKKAVLNEGLLRGGYGLPKDIRNVTMHDNRVVTPQMVQEMDEWLEMLEGAEDKDFDPNAFEGMTLDEDLTQRTSQLERLRKLVSSDDWQARRAAVKKLATARELDNVPILIYALTDKDSEVPTYARDGLRFISRKFSGFDMPERASADQKQAAAEKWKKWYLSIRPDGELLD